MDIVLQSILIPPVARDTRSRQLLCHTIVLAEAFTTNTFRFLYHRFEANGNNDFTPSYAIYEHRAPSKMRCLISWMIIRRARDASGMFFSSFLFLLTITYKQTTCMEWEWDTRASRSAAGTTGIATVDNMIQLRRQATQHRGLQGGRRRYNKDSNNNHWNQRTLTATRGRGRPDWKKTQETLSFSGKFFLPRSFFFLL